MFNLDFSAVRTAIIFAQVAENRAITKILAEILGPESADVDVESWIYYGKYGEKLVSSVACHFSTIVTIVMRQFENRCHNSMHSYANIVISRQS